MNYSLINYIFLSPGKQATFGLPSHVFSTKSKLKRSKLKREQKKGWTIFKSNKQYEVSDIPKMFSECSAVFYYTLFL